MNRQEMLATIDALYEMRIAGQTEPMAAHVAQGATFCFAGEGQMAAFGSDGPVGFLDALGGLNTGIAMREIERKAVIAEGNRCAIRFVAEVQFTGREPFQTEIFTLWSFDEAGKVESVVEFVDTAKLASEMQAFGSSLI